MTERRFVPLRPSPLKGKGQPLRVLLTGATGVVGSELRDQLRALGDVDLVCVSSRGAPAEDVVAWRLGSQPPPPPVLTHFDVVIHTAASTKWEATPEQAWQANVESTRALLDVLPPDAHLVHLSTAYAVGRRGSWQSERVEDYRNTYEWSKAAAERLVHSRHRRTTIVRPPLICGRRSDGKAARFSGIFTVLRTMASGLAPALIGDRRGHVDIVAVDDVAHVVQASIFAPDAPREPRIESLGLGHRSLTVHEVLSLLREGLNSWRERHGAPPIAPLPIIPVERWERFLFPFSRSELTGSQLRAVQVMNAFRPYLIVGERLAADHVVPDVRETIRRSSRYWADQHRSLALRDAKPWSAKRVAPALS
jgi:nucleoside-diphosphate-sugar epimerase